MHHRARFGVSEEQALFNVLNVKGGIELKGQAGEVYLNPLILTSITSWYSCVGIENVIWQYCHMYNKMILEIPKMKTNRF